MKIIVDDNIPYIKGRFPAGVETVYVDQFGFTPQLVKDADALVIRTRTSCDERLLGESKVKLVATATIGTDQIDMDWCAANGITVRNAPGCNAPGVAQYVWSSLLRLGFEPSRHTLGIVGCGNVGGIVHQWGRALGARMLVSDPPREERERSGNVTPDGIEYAPLPTLLQQCDAVTLHTPLTRAGSHPTHHLIGEEELALIGDGKIFINAARGPVVDFAALKPHVMSGRIRAVIDTWEGEPVIDPGLLDKVEYGTFHIAGYSRQGKERATRMALEALDDVLHVKTDLSGLEGRYEGCEGISAKGIVDSYDPAIDTLALRRSPEKFDVLRANYDYREEVTVNRKP